MNRKCTNCGNFLLQRFKIKFCSNKCQSEYQYKMFIESWKNGKQNGVVGVGTRSISKHLRRYLIEKNSGQCFQCKWGKRHPITGRIVLEIDHIDGNSENNAEQNLRLLCPNCHSLTPFFRNLNRGNGRKWRIQKYRSNVSR